MRHAQPNCSDSLKRCPLAPRCRRVVPAATYLVVDGISPSPTELRTRRDQPSCRRGSGDGLGVMCATPCFLHPCSLGRSPTPMVVQRSMREAPPLHYWNTSVRRFSWNGNDVARSVRLSPFERKQLKNCSGARGGRNAYRRNHEKIPSPHFVLCWSADVATPTQAATRSSCRPADGSSSESIVRVANWR